MRQLWQAFWGVGCNVGLLCGICLTGWGHEASGHPSDLPHLPDLPHLQGPQKPETQESSLSPYLDALEEGMESEGSTLSAQSSGGYTEALQNSLPPEPARVPPSQEGLGQAPQTPEVSYSEQIQERLGSARGTGGAIEALHAGRSQLQAQKKGAPQHVFGLRYGVSLHRSLWTLQSSEDAMNHFDELYGANYAPDLSFFYEYFLLQHQRIGSLGVMGLGGLTYFHGKGRFPFELTNPSGGVFSDLSQTRFQLFALPLTFALSVRMNVFHFLRPYAFTGPTGAGYVEIRSDSQKGNRGSSLGWLSGGGVAILLDGISPSSSWQMYVQNHIRHQYLTFDYSRLTHRSGKVQYTFSGWLLGLAFEI